MKNLVSTKLYIITLIFVLGYLTVDFYIKKDKLFFQLNYDWSDIKITSNYGNVYLDSISYDYISIKNPYQIKSIAKQGTLINTISLNDKYYFRFSSVEHTDSHVIYKAGFWINSMPKSTLTKANLKNVDLQLIQKGTNKVCMIGDSQITYREGKFTRRRLYSKLKNTVFVGDNKDLYGYPYNSSTLNTSNKVLNTFNQIPPANVYVLFLGAHEKNIEDIKINFKVIIDELIKKSEKVLLIIPPKYTNPQKKDVSQALRNIYLNYKRNKNVNMIDLFELIDDPKIYLEPDGIHLNKLGHQFLTELLIKYLKEYEN